MNKLFLVENDDLTRQLFEEIFGERIYTLSSSEDLSFRLPDFAQDMVLFGAEIFLKDSLVEMERIKVCADIPFALMGFEPQQAAASELGWKGAFLLKPLEIKHLEQIIADLHTQLSKS